MFRGSVRPVVFGVVLLVAFQTVSGIVYGDLLTPIDFSFSHDLRIQTIGQGPGVGGGNVGVASEFPEGSLAFSGVPFETPVGGLNAWSAGIKSGATGTQILNVPVGIYGVGQVYTLINTIWGEQVAGTLATVKFYGSAGDVHQVNLDGNNHIRDWLYGGYANSINGTTTTNAFITHPGVLNVESRLDMQIFDLPVAFDTQILEFIQFVDAGAIGTQRLLVYGITTESVEISNPVPEPSVLNSLVALGIGVIVLCRKKMMRG